MLLLAAVAIQVATPMPPARVQIGCPFMPIFFEDGTASLSEQSRVLVEQAFDWVLSDAPQDVRIVLRTYAHDSDDNRIVELSSLRAESARAAFAAQGVPPDQILVAHEYRSGTNLGPEGWRGGWIYPEFYVSPSVYRRIMPRDGSVC